MRRPIRTKPPKSTAAMTTTTAIVSIAFTVGSIEKPSMSTTAVSPVHSATTAANAMRRGPATSAPHRPGDDDPLDLVRALVDLGDLRVAHHPLDRILVDVAVATEYLHGLDGHCHGG